MSVWRQLTRGVRALTNRSATDRDVADEVEQYLDDATSAWVESGLSPHDARRAARRELGNTVVVREQVRSYGWENAVESLAADVRYAARRLSKNPGFTALGALTHCPRRRRQHHDLQRGESDSLRAAAVSACRSGRDDLGPWPRRSATRRHLRHLPGASGAEPLLRSACRHEAVAADNDRREPARASRWPTRE